MKLEWMGPYEVQILEHVLEYADQNKNMKWYADQLGLSQATYSKYVRKLVEKGLLEKYHTSDNKKNIILKLSPLAMKEYETYSKNARKYVFNELFAFLDSISPEELEAVRKAFSIFGRWHGEYHPGADEKKVELIPVKKI